MDDGLDRPPSRDLGSLRPALRFLRPYLWQVVLASLALIVTAGVTLSIGQGMRLVIDQGLGEGSAVVLEQTIALFAVLMLLLTAGTFMRFYFVSWVGERVSADIRLAVFNHIVRLHPGFFERNQPTEIQSRITTDTTLLQTVIGSSVSIALRNALMFVGGLVLLFVTNAKLSLVVIASVPFVVAPVILFGRSVRRLSRRSQDTLADVGSYAGESLRHIKVVQSFNH
ncbi:MAG: ABC transporter transmembrane domain-containing protein, partial [Pseudomonadales bacterium]